MMTTNLMVLMMILSRQKIFTDGSRTPEATLEPWSIFMNNDCLIHQETCKLDDHCSNFQAEATAITAVLKLINSNFNHHPNIAILTDSLSTLMAINKLTNKQSPIISRINGQLNDIHQKGINIHFYWVKSHFDINGNQLTDE